MNDKAKELTPAENVLIEFTRYLKQRAELFREDEEDFHRRMNEAKSQEEAYEWASEAITAREKYRFAEHLLHELDYLEVLFGMRVLQDGERKPFGCTVKYFDEDDESDE